MIGSLSRPMPHLALLSWRLPLAESQGRVPSLGNFVVGDRGHVLLRSHADRQRISRPHVTSFALCLQLYRALTIVKGEPYHHA